MMFAWLQNLTRSPSWLAPVGDAASKLARPLVITSILVTGATLGLRHLGLMEAAELAAYDQLIQLQPDDETDERLLVVGVTEHDLQTLREWPISDLTLAQALTNIQQHQPQTIAVDIFRDFPNEPGTEELLTQLQNPNTLTICKVSSAHNIGTPPPPGIFPEQVGFADLVVDPGGILRRSLLMAGVPEPDIPFSRQHTCNQPNQVLLSLSLQAARRYLAAQGIEASFTEDGELIFGDTIIPQIQPDMGGYQGADTRGYQLMLRYRSERQAVTQVSLMEVLEGQVDPALIRDRIVFIGYTTPQASDDFYTPYSISRDDQQKMAGVVVHAQSASQLISTVLDGRALIWVWPTAADILWILAWSVVGGISGWYLRHPAGFAVAILVGYGSLYGLCLLLFSQGGWIPLIPPTITFVGTAVGIVLLDRFNRSSYGRQVYRKVKTFLRLEIDIDEQRLEKQVSEITETDYFRDLRDKVKLLRQEPDQAPVEEKPSDLEWNQGGPVNPWQHQPDDGVLNGAANGLEHLLPQMQALPPKTEIAADLHPLHPDSKLSQIESLSAPMRPLGKSVSDDDALDFTQDLRRKAQSLKQSLSTGSSRSTDSQFSSRDREASPIPSVPQTPFVLESTFCQWTDASAETTAHVAYLTQQLSILRAGIQAEKAHKMHGQDAAIATETESPTVSH